MQDASFSLVGRYEIKLEFNENFKQVISTAAFCLDKNACKYNIIRSFGWLSFYCLGLFPIGGTIELALKRGRKDCESGPLPKRIFPAGSNPHGIEFLKAEFDLSTRQAVALLGNIYRS